MKEWKEDEVQTAYHWKFEELKATASGILNGFRNILNFLMAMSGYHYFLKSKLMTNKQGTLNTNDWTNGSELVIEF